MAAAPRSLSMAELIDALYCDRADGGPETARPAINCYVTRARTKLRPLDLWIVRLERRFLTLLAGSA